VPTVPIAFGFGTIRCAKNFQRALLVEKSILQKLLILQRVSDVCAVGIAQALKKLLDH
jgi:hypothetical protein